jgi:hypothetical protein
MNAIELHPSPQLNEVNLADILRRRFGDRYKVQMDYMRQTAKQRRWHPPVPIVTVTINPLVRVNVRLVRQYNRTVLTFAADTPEDFIFWFMSIVFPLAFLFLFLTRSTVRRFMAAIVTAEWTPAERVALAPLTGVNGGRPQIYTGTEGFRRAYPILGGLLTSVWDVAWIVVGLIVSAGPVLAIGSDLNRLLRPTNADELSLWLIALGAGLPLGICWLVASGADLVRFRPSVALGHNLAAGWNFLRMLGALVIILGAVFLFGAEWARLFRAKDGAMVIGLALVAAAIASRWLLLSAATVRGRAPRAAVVLVVMIGGAAALFGTGKLVAHITGADRRERSAVPAPKLERMEVPVDKK